MGYGTYVFNDIKYRLVFQYGCNIFQSQKQCVYMWSSAFISSWEYFCHIILLLKTILPILTDVQLYLINYYGISYDVITPATNDGEYIFHG